MFREMEEATSRCERAPRAAITHAEAAATRGPAASISGAPTPRALRRPAPAPPRRARRSPPQVHMMTTTGTQEKCIDIQLAVEMMHFASVPGAYGRAVLELTGCTAALHERRRTSCLPSHGLPSHRYDRAVLLSGDKHSSPRSRASDRKGAAGRPPLPHATTATTTTTTAAAAAAAHHHHLHRPSHRRPRQVAPLVQPCSRDLPRPRPHVCVFDPIWEPIPRNAPTATLHPHSGSHIRSRIRTTGARLRPDLARRLPRLPHRPALVAGARPAAPPPPPVQRPPARRRRRARAPRAVAPPLPWPAAPPTSTPPASSPPRRSRARSPSRTRSSR